MATTTYGAENITVLEGLEAVRKRPGMYIGSVTTKGLNHLIYEIVDNSVDEHITGFCNNIWVTLEKDGSATIEDDGRGIPVELHAKGVSATRLVFTTLHAGGKFDDSVYKTSGGLHGVGESGIRLGQNVHIVLVLESVKVGGSLYEIGFLIFGEGVPDGNSGLIGFRERGHRQHEDQSQHESKSFLHEKILPVKFGCFHPYACIVEHFALKYKLCSAFFC